MAQFRIDTQEFPPSTKTLFEVNMVADETGAIEPAAGGTVVSANNSTATPLDAGLTFTGEWEDVTAYNSIIVAVATDEDGEITIEFSPDGVNVDEQILRLYHAPHDEKPHRYTVTRQYFRIKFKNTSITNQTFLRLQILLGDKAEINVRLDAQIHQDQDAYAVRPSHYRTEVALERRRGAVTWSKWGFNSDVDTGGDETIWSAGGVFTPMLVANTLNIASSNTQDTSSNTGVSSVKVIGIDENRIAIEEIVTVDGTANTTTTKLFLGVNRVSIAAVGSNKVNLGDITIAATTGGSLQGFMPAETGSTQQLFFFTQAGHQSLVDWVLINVLKVAPGTTPVVTIKGWIHDFIIGSRYEVFRHIVDTAIENTVSVTPQHPFIIGGSTLFEITTSTDVNNTSVAGRISLIEIRDVGD